MISFRSWLEHEYLYDEPSSSAGGSNSPRTDSRIDRAYAAGALLPKGSSSIFVNDSSKIAKPEFDLKNKRIVLSSYRQPPIATPIKNQDVSVDPYHGGKPTGGIWYSYGNEWIDYAFNNSLGHLRMFVHELFIETSKIVKIHDQKSKEDFEAKYGKKVSNGPYGDLLINWPQVVKDYSGVEVIKNGLTGDTWQTYWDIPSGCIWDQSAIRDSKLLYVYNVKTKRYTRASELGVYAGLSSKSKNPLPPAERK